MINFSLRQVEHKELFITSGPGLFVLNVDKCWHFNINEKDRLIDFGLSILDVHVFN